MSRDMRFPLLKSALTALVGVVEIAINEIAFLEEEVDGGVEKTHISI